MDGQLPHTDDIQLPVKTKKARSLIDPVYDPRLLQAVKVPALAQTIESPDLYDDADYQDLDLGIYVPDRPLSQSSLPLSSPPVGNQQIQTPLQLRNNLDPYDPHIYHPHRPNNGEQTVCVLTNCSFLMILFTFPHILRAARP